jgi:hypothetical protein
MKKFVIIAIALMSCSLSAQTMYVRPLVGTQSSYNTDNVQKLTFSNGNMLVTSTLGAVESNSLVGNRYINFTDLTLSTFNPAEVQSGFYVYPNPSSELLYVTNIHPNKSIELVQVVSLEGKLLLGQKPASTSNVELNIVALPQGIYLCNITSGNQLQTIKFIKQ